MLKINEKKEGVYSNIIHVDHHINSLCENEQNKKEKKSHSAAGNRTPVSRVTGGDTNHYTTADRKQ